MILPWSHDDPAQAFDQVVRLVWGFWQRMEKCPNGVPYYLQHQVWKPEHDPRGLGGDQISMALSSWNLLHGYLGDAAVVANMRLMADYWLAHGMTGPGGPWPNLPFPYNTDVHSGRYDGDMVAGKGFLQPDKAGAFGAELVDSAQDHGRAALPGGGDRDREHAGAQREAGRCRSLAVALPSPRRDRARCSPRRTGGSTTRRTGWARCASSTASSGWGRAA